MTGPEAWAALATLTALEIIPGIDNVVFISILSGRLPRHQQRTARLLGLAMAFSLFVEMLNIKAGARRAQPVRLHQPSWRKALEKSDIKK